MVTAMPMGLKQSAPLHRRSCKSQSTQLPRKPTESPAVACVQRRKLGGDTAYNGARPRVTARSWPSAKPAKNRSGEPILMLQCPCPLLHVLHTNALLSMRVLLLSGGLPAACPHPCCREPCLHGHCRRRLCWHRQVARPRRARDKNPKGKPNASAFAAKFAGRPITLRGSGRHLRRGAWPACTERHSRGRAAVTSTSWSSSGKHHRKCRVLPRHPLQCKNRWPDPTARGTQPHQTAMRQVTASDAEAQLLLQLPQLEPPSNRAPGQPHHYLSRCQH
mmetsp:Transcript_6152/g.17929  ORF Transcript_6152/g.17929 Transcript_6152/m.17929 type:complete len:276 (-) Transcript_6152:257-1084(-)